MNIRFFFLIVLAVLQSVASARESVHILQAGFREGNQEIYDITYMVEADSPFVETRLLAFRDGVRSFSHVVKPTVYVDDIDGNDTRRNIGCAV